MKKALAWTMMLLGVVFSLPAPADDTSLKFKGGIGVIPVSSVTCVPSATPYVTGPTVTVNQNVVRGQQAFGPAPVTGLAGAPAEWTPLGDLSLSRSNQRRKHLSALWAFPRYIPNAASYHDGFL
jgi:hypothetical protein